MPYYKNTNNELYFLDSVKFKHLIPADCTSITEKEAIAIQVKQKADAEALISIIVPPTAEELMAQLFAIQIQIESLKNNG